MPGQLATRQNKGFSRRAFILYIASFAWLPKLKKKNGLTYHSDARNTRRKRVIFCAMLVSFSLGNVKFVKLQRTWKVVSHGQIINNYSPKWRWIAVGIYWGKYTPTPRRIIVLVYTIQVNSNSQIVALFSDEMGFARKALCGPREVPFLHYWAAVIVPCDKHTVQTAFQHSNGFPSINYWERRSEYTCSEYTWIETKTDPRWGNEHSWISQGPFLLIDALGAFQSKCQKSRQRKK